jgi:hypothetical protein
MFMCSINAVLNVGAAGELTRQIFFYLWWKKRFEQVQRTVACSIGYFLLWCVISFTFPFHAE